MSSHQTNVSVLRRVPQAVATHLMTAVFVASSLACAGGGQQPGASTGSSKTHTAGEVGLDNAASTAASTNTAGQANGAAAEASVGTSSNANTVSPPVSLVIPKLTAQSPQVAAATGSGAIVPLIQVLFQDSAASASSTLTGTTKQFEITALDYDPCPFYYAHAQTSAGVYNYKVAPTKAFNFSGVYLVNGAVGTPLTAGTYTVGASSGLQVVTDNHISGINFDLDACKIGSFVGFLSGTVTIDAVSTDGKHSPVSGSMNLVTSDGGNLTGAFAIGHCTSGNTAFPVAPTPDPDACTL